MVALYKKIYEELKTKIEEGKIKVGQPIPSEAQIRMKYNCSRDTVRKATAMLEQANYIDKTRGKQPVVKLRTKYIFPTSKIETFKELNLRNKLKAKTEVISIENNFVEKNSFSQHFENCVEVKRVRSIEGEKVVLDIDYFDRDIVGKLNNKICKNSIYEYIETNLDICIGYSKKIVTVEKPTSYEKKLLDLKENDLLVNVESYTFTSDNVMFQATISKHRFDKFKFESFATR